jgi:hypothetical protein
MSWDDHPEYGSPQTKGKAIFFWTVVILFYGFVFIAGVTLLWRWLT